MNDNLAEKGAFIQAGKGAQDSSAPCVASQADVQALIASEQRFRTLVEMAPGGFLLTDAMGVASYATSTITRLMGYTMDEVIGRNIFSFVHPDDMTHSFEIFSNVLQTPLAKGTSEFRARHKDGSWKWMEGIAQNFLDDPAIGAICLNLWDVSARKAAEAAVRANEARLRRLIDSNMVGIFFWRSDGRITEANDRFLRMIGYSREDLVSNGINSEAMTPPEYAHLDRAGLQQIATAGVCAPFEKEYIRKDGSRLPILIGAARLEDSSGEGVCYVVDVTDRKRVEMELVRERNLLRTLLDHIPDYIYVKDTAARYLTTNKANLEIIGLGSPEELRGKTVNDVFPSEIAEGYLADDVAVLKSGRPIIDREEPIVGPQGETRWLLTTKVPLREPGGAVNGLVGISRDVTERKRSEALLASERNLFRSILDNLPLCVYVLDREQRFLLNNRAHLRLLGLESEAEARTRRLSDFAPRSTNEAEAMDIEAVLSTGVAVFDREQAVTDPAGRQRTHLTSKVPLLGTDGTPMGVICISQDITERTQAREQIEKLAAFPQLNPNPVFEFSDKGVLGYFNAAAQSLTQLAGKSHPSEILPDFAVSIIHECVTTGEPRLRLESELGERTVSWSFFPTLNGVVHCYAADLTERVALETQLRQAQKMESVGQLAGGIAHDFNNLLTVIQGHASLLLGQSPTAEVQSSAREISEASDRAANLTRQLLAFSRRQVLQPRSLDLNNVVASVAGMLQRVLGEDIVFNVRYASNLPPVHADPGMLEQVLMNLAVNSRDAMPKGGRLDIALRAVALDATGAQQYADARAGTFVVLSVADNGCGIPTENLEHVFEPFFTTKDVGHGTGLGLATVYGIVKQHNGWISLRSEMDRGTTFDIFLPASDRRVTPVSSTKAAARHGTECILLVEDEEALRELVRCVLENYGYTVIDAPNGRHAYEVWRKRAGDIDMLLTDIVMPDGVTGRDLAEALKQEKPNLRILFSSGYSSDIIGKDFVLADGVNFLQKPYNPHTLAQTVRECLDR